MKINVLTVRTIKDKKLLTAIGFDCESNAIYITISLDEISKKTELKLIEEGFSYSNDNVLYIETEVYHLIDRRYEDISIQIEKIEIN
jgi:hypothetical protein